MDKLCVSRATKTSRNKKKKKKNNADNQTLSHLSNIIDSEKMTLDELANNLCTNLCEYNKVLMCKYPFRL